MLIAPAHGSLGAVEKRRPTDRLELVGERLRLFREAVELTQEQLGGEVGKERNTIAMWEAGQRLLDVLAATRLAERFGVSLDWFYRGDLSGVRADLAGRISAAIAEPDRIARTARPFGRAKSSASPALKPVVKPKRRAGR